MSFISVCLADTAPADANPVDYPYAVSYAFLARKTKEKNLNLNNVSMNSFVNLFKESEYAIFVTFSTI